MCFERNVCSELIHISSAACFNTKTGDVEDAPAPEPLAVFSVTEKDGAVYVQGEGDHIKAGKRSLQFKLQAQPEQKVVVVGG